MVCSPYHVLSPFLDLSFFSNTESTSVALSATFGYLAIQQEDQEKAYLEINKAIPKGREPVRINFHSLILHPSPRIRCRKI